MTTRKDLIFKYTINALNHYTKTKEIIKNINEHITTSKKENEFIKSIIKDYKNYFKAL